MKIRTPPPPPSKNIHRAPPPPPPPATHGAVAITHGATTARASQTAAPIGRPAPPRPHSQSAFVPPRPPPPPGVGSVSYGCTGATASTNTVSPAFMKQVQQMSDADLKSMASGLKMEMFHARLTGNPARAADAQKKLTYIENQLHLRQVKQEMTSRFQYQREVCGMSTDQLSAARSKEGQAMFTAFIRGDMAGVKEAQSKLAILDAEIGKREADLARFQQSIGGMSPIELDNLGAKLADQFSETLFNPQASGAQRDDIFNKLSMLIAEHMARSLGGAIGQAFSGCFDLQQPAGYAK